jgi:hypothetical protein
MMKFLFYLREIYHLIHDINLFVYKSWEISKT